MAACQDARLRWADAGADHPRHGLAGADAHAHTQRPVIELRSIQVRPDFVHGRSVRFTRYLLEQQSSPSRVEVTDAHAPTLRGAHVLLDQPLPAHRARLRTAAPTPRRDDPMGDDRPHDPPPRPPPHLKPLFTRLSLVRPYGPWAFEAGRSHGDRSQGKGGVIVHQAYRFALDPTRRQQRALASHVGGARFAYNWGLDLVKRRLDERAAGQDVEVPWTLPALRREWNGAKAAVAADRRAGFPPAPFESRPTATM